MISKRRRFFFGAGAVLIFMIISYLIIRPFHLSWGATENEVSMSMPGDLPGPRWTRAVTVNATPDAIYPWLVQWGQGRGGWYSYDWLENLFGFNIHTAGTIIEEYQNPEIGDPICMAENTCTSFVSVIEPNKWFGWQSPDPDGKPVWTFMLGLISIDDTSTRLVVRESFDVSAIPAPLISIIEIPDVVMELKMLDTVKLRAEGVLHSPIVTFIEISLWVVALVIGLFAAFWFITWPDWKKPLATGFMAIAVLMVLTFLYPPLWLRAIFDTALTGLAIWVNRDH